MTREEAIKEIEKAFEPAFANYIITALTEGATASDKEQETCEDAVSRTEVLNLVRFNAFHVKSQIKAIENMPSVTPQEQFKPMVEIDLYSVIKQSYIEREVLDKIRADIEAVIQKETVVDKSGGEYEHIVSKLDPDDVLQIIDKYKAESEET